MYCRNGKTFGLRGCDPVADAAYRDGVLTVEPKGTEPVSESERHGHTFSVFTLWLGANVEMATVVTGTLGIVLFGLSFWQAALSYAVGTVLGCIALGVLSTFGPRLGVPQLVQSRRAFGYFGNFAPGVLNLLAGMGWFAVNSVVGVFALTALTGMGYGVAVVLMAAVQIAIAVYGYNLIHSLERYLSLLLVVIFGAATVFAVMHAHLGLPANPKAPLAFGGTSGGVITTIGTAFSYMLGWMAFASDYTRYLPSTTSRAKVFWAAFAGNLVGALWPEILGLLFVTMAPALAATANGVQLVDHLLPHGLAVLTLIAVVVGTITANVLNIYSAGLSALVVRLPVKRWQAALGVGVLGGVATLFGGANFSGNLENFLLLLAYWVSPWMVIMLLDVLVVHRNRTDTEPFYDLAHRFGVGCVAWLIAAVGATWLFGDQTLHVGPIAYANPQLGDLSYWVGLVAAGGLYLAGTALWPTGRVRPTPVAPTLGRAET
jgi:NCS1 family nucleobase:cation symporter-1